MKKNQDGKMEATRNTAINNTLRSHGQFVPADALEAFCSDFMDIEQCRRWILERIHQDCPRCPKCGTIIPDSSHNRFWAAERLQCKACGKFFTALTGTFLNGTHMSMSKIFLLAFFLGLDVPDRFIAGKLEINQETIRLWRLRFQAASIA
jgi:transposase-like protein